MKNEHAKTLTLRLDVAQANQLVDIQIELKIKTSAKAVKYLIKNWKNEAAENAKLRDDFQELTIQNQLLESRIENARAAAAHLLEKTAQSDLLT